MQTVKFCKSRYGPLPSPEAGLSRTSVDPNTDNPSRAGIIDRYDVDERDDALIASYVLLSVGVGVISTS
jgi:hypothetical protein